MEDKGEVFPKADLTELPKPKTKSKKKRELYAKVKSKVSCWKTEPLLSYYHYLLHSLMQRDRRTVFSHLI